ISGKVSLQHREFQQLLPNGTYWNATENVFQLPEELGTKTPHISSIYIPNTIPILSEALAADLNASINLDLLAPGFESHPEVAAIYFISDSAIPFTIQISILLATCRPTST
ncbi:MAG: hypothetical protein IPP55_15140, partial [Anaerolineales bacterium]|nr:hypothetical protein [Anaerolineales bacterium]